LQSIRCMDCRDNRWSTGFGCDHISTIRCPEAPRFVRRRRELRFVTARVVLRSQSRQMSQISNAQISPEMTRLTAIPVAGLSASPRSSSQSGDGPASPRKSGIRAGLTLSIRPGLRRSNGSGGDASAATEGSRISDTRQYLSCWCPVYRPALKTMVITISRSGHA
jgi:hypothetical protein